MTRCWLLDLARQVPSSWILLRFDVSTSQYSAAQRLPQNVSLRVLDAFDDIPPELIMKFDMVHVRAFLVVVKGGDSGPLLKNLVKLLSVFCSLQRVKGLAEGFLSLQNREVTSSGMSSTQTRSPLTLPRASFPHMQMKSSKYGASLLRH